MELLPWVYGMISMDLDLWNYFFGSMKTSQLATGYHFTQLNTYRINPMPIRLLSVIAGVTRVVIRMWNF
jgi:hypothetical protein